MRPESRTGRSRCTKPVCYNYFPLFDSHYCAAEAFLDPTVWAIVLISFTNALPTGGLGAFSNLILTAFVSPFKKRLGRVLTLRIQGFTQLQTYLLAIAQGAIIMTFLFSAAYLSKRYNNKLLFAFVSASPDTALLLHLTCLQLYTLPNIAGTIVFLSKLPTNAMVIYHTEHHAQRSQRPHTRRLGC